MEHRGGLKSVLDECLHVCVCVFIGVSLCIRFCVFNVSSEDQTQVLIACTANTFPDWVAPSAPLMTFNTEFLLSVHLSLQKVLFAVSLPLRDTPILGQSKEMKRKENSGNRNRTFLRDESPLRLAAGRQNRC